MRKLTKKLFDSNLIRKSTFTIHINVYNSNFTNCEPLFYTMRCNKDNNPKTSGKTYSSTKAFNIISINSLFCFSFLVSFMKIFNTAVKWWNAAIVEASEYFIRNSHRHLYLSWVMMVPSLHWGSSLLGTMFQYPLLMRDGIEYAKWPD